MGGQVSSASACYPAALWVRIQTSPKNTNGRHKQMSGQHTLACQKYTKKYSPDSTRFYYSFAGMRHSAHLDRFQVQNELFYQKVSFDKINVLI